MTKKILFLFTVIFITCRSLLFGQDVVRVLAIGNSFSVDALEDYLYDLGKADEVTFVIGIMYIGGGSLEAHWTNAQSDDNPYSYCKIDATGKKVITENTRLSMAIADEEWDYITFQQVSQNSGLYETYFPYLTNLIEYVKERVTNDNVTYAMHLTWAYAQSSTHGGFANYNGDQLTMYNAIINTVTSVAEELNIATIIPSGTTIQNARTSFIGDNLCRDGYHLDMGIGRYMAACTWFGKLTGRAVSGNTFMPAGIPIRNVALAQKAADNALENPFEVTDMSSDYALPDPFTFDLEVPVNIDFGSTFSDIPWNNMSSFGVGTRIQGLTNMSGEYTPFNIEITVPFGGINTSGPNNGLEFPEWSIPQSASSDSFHGNAGEPFNGRIYETGGLLISDLNPNKEYTFSMLASRTASDNRETYFTVEGTTKETVYVNSAGNTTKLAVVNKMVPKTNGTVRITVGAGPNNNNSNKFFYINALQIREYDESVSVAEQESANLNYFLYPNPSSDRINILGLSDEEYYYTIITPDGKMIQDGVLLKSRNIIDISVLQNSCYILQLQDTKLSQLASFYFIKQ